MAIAILADKLIGVDEENAPFLAEIPEHVDSPMLGLDGRFLPEADAVYFFMSPQPINLPPSPPTIEIQATCQGAQTTPDHFVLPPKYHLTLPAFSTHKHQ